MFENMVNGIIKTPETIVKENNLEQVDNTDEIIKVIHQLIKENPEKVESYKHGNQKLFGFFVGQIMKLTDGKANPASVNKILKDELDRL
jgi:aspartyl-tRNA(Asn)/glutamyl-tRNA(Gln) amidotransferase subunit B